MLYFSMSYSLYRSTCEKAGAGGHSWKITFAGFGPKQSTLAYRIFHSKTNVSFKTQEQPITINEDKV